MGAIEFIVQNWSPRETAQVALKFGLLLLPIVLWRWMPGSSRRADRLVLLFGAATGVLGLVVAYIQILRGEYSASLNKWEDQIFAVEIAGYQLGCVLAGAWCALRRQDDALRGVAFALLACVGFAALANLFAWGGASPQVAQLGVWALGLGLALLVSAALGRVAWVRIQLAIVAFAFAWFAGVHLHAWLIEGRISMGHVGPSLWHDLALPAVIVWVLRRR